MKIKNYVGVEQSVIIIESPDDLYAILDHFQNRMIEKYEETNDERYNQCAEFMCSLLDQTEEAGFGNSQDADTGFGWFK